MLNLYETYYKLSADPFRLNPDHRFSFGHRSYAKAKAYLEYALQRGEGFIVITGGPGTGKTTLINGILAGLNKARVRVATLTSTRLVPVDLLHMVAASFGLHFEDMSKATLLLGLEEYLTQQSRQGWRSILIVDEAQDLSPSAVEELRLLANLQHNNRLLLQVFLVGHEELRELVRAPGMEHLRQRIIAASHLEPMDLDETVNYIEHRLCRAGWQGDPAISADALRLIHKFSGGIPRRVNLICSRLFLYGGMERKHKLVGEDAWSVIEDLRQELLMAPEDAGEVYDGIAARANSEAQAVAQSLPRPQSFARADQAGSCRSLQGTEKPMTDARRQPRTKAGRSARSVRLVRENYPRIEPVVGEEALDDVRTPGAVPVVEASPPVQIDIDAGQGMGWRWWAAAAVILAVGLTLATNIETEIRDRLMNFIRPVAMETDSPARTVVAEAEQQGPIEDNLSDTEAPRIRPALVDTKTSAEIPTATDAALQTDRQRAVEVSAEDPERVGLASELSQRPVEEGPGHAEVTGTEPQDGQAAEPLMATADAVIEAEHSRVRDEADQHFSQQLTAIELAPEPVASPEFEPIDQLTDASSAPSTEPATPAGRGSPGLVKDAQIEATSDVPSEAADRPSGSASAASIMPARPAGAETEGVSAPPVSRVLPVVRVRAIESDRAEPADRPPGSARVASITPASPAGAETGGVSALPVSRVPAAVERAREPAPDRAEPVAAVLPAPVTPPARMRTPVPTVVATAPSYGLGASVGSRDQVKSALLGGQWNSRGKPAVLLPSEITYCKSAGEHINCWSVPQDINTKFGPALYKVEGTLQDFSAQGSFRLSYRTLVRLVDSDARQGTNTETASAEGRWQITEHAMSCELTQPDNIRCRDEKGITRTYNR